MTKLKVTNYTLINYIKNNFKLFNKNKIKNINEIALIFIIFIFIYMFLFTLTYKVNLFYLHFKLIKNLLNLFVIIYKILYLINIISDLLSSILYAPKLNAYLELISKSKFLDLNLDQLEIIIKTLKIFIILSKVKDFKALTYQILNKLFQILVYKVFQHYVGSYVDSKELFFSEKNILFYMNNVISFLNNHINDFNV